MTKQGKLFAGANVEYSHQNHIQRITKILKDRIVYWKARALAAEDLAQYEPSDSKTYSKYLEAEEKLNKLKEKEQNYV